METDGVGAEGPGNLSVKEPCDPGVAASLSQNVSHSATRRHRAPGAQLMLQSPFLRGAGEHGDVRVSGKHTGSHVMLRSP